MRQEIWDALDSEFRKFPIMRAIAPADLSEIHEAERRLGVAFNADYSEFIARFGGAVVGAYPIFGLRPVSIMDNTLWSVVTVTERYRSQDIPCLGTRYVISEDHSGNPISLSADGSVWLFDHDAERDLPTSPSFAEFIWKICPKLIE